MFFRILEQPAGRLRGLQLFILLVLLVLAATEAGAARVALVIGNQNYTNLESLQKSAGDAAAYGALFESKGFDRVIIRQDLTRQDMDMAIAEFLAAIQPGDTAAFVYSGHGWSDGTQNYLVGVDAPRSGSEEFLRRISVPIRNGATGIVDEMTARGATLKVAIIDACRDNPFADEGGTRSIGLDRGFNRLPEPPPEGTFLVFSAGAGQVALDRLSDSDPSPNGLFTRTFLPLLAQDMTLLDATKAAQEAVFNVASTAGYLQQPAFYDETRGNKACLWNDCTSAGTSSITPDTAAWLSIAASTDPADFQSFARLFPDSPLRSEADARAAQLLAALEPEAAPATPVQPIEPQAPAPVPTPVPTSDAADDTRDLPRLVQAELQRLGCYRSRIDGQWGPRSREALLQFGARADINVTDRSPDAALLAILETQRGTICPDDQPDIDRSVPGNNGTSTASLGCYNVRITVDERKANGSVWDVGSATTSQPDPQIAETTTGVSTRCRDTRSCTLQVRGGGGQLSFVITDIDLSSHDAIGQATCRAGSSCRAGSAAISMSAC